MVTLEHLQALIEEQIKPSRNDTIYFLGDYIDRGPDSKGVIDYIITLRRMITISGPYGATMKITCSGPLTMKQFTGTSWEFHYTNKLKKEWFKYGGKETLDSFHVSDVHDVPAKYITWMRELEYYIKLDPISWCMQVSISALKIHFSDKPSMLWIKEFKVDPLKTGNRKIIHGHVPVSLDFIDSLRSGNHFDFIDLDNGIYIENKAGFGNLVALELISMEMKVQPNVDKP